MRLPNETFCVNHEFGQADSKQWCYVSDSCESGKPLQWPGPFSVGEIAPPESEPVKFKWCDEDEAKLSDKAPPELFEWTKANNLDFGMTAHFVYPVFDTNVKLTSDVLSFFHLKPPEGAPENKVQSNVTQLSDTNLLMKSLKQRADEGTTALFSSVSKNPPYGIMKGKKLYWVNFSDEQYKHLKSGGDFFSHPGTIHDVKCVAGCEETVPAWMSPINEKVDQPSPKPKSSSEVLLSPALAAMADPNGLFSISGTYSARATR